MKKIKLFYNPNSGNKQFKNCLDTVVEKMQRAGYEISFFRCCRYGDIGEYFENNNLNEYDIIGVSGGDGTINIVINAMMNNNVDRPLAIFPSGTANDFAGYLGLDTNIDRCCDTIIRGKTRSVDLGLANDMYFVNVCAGGLFSNVSFVIDKKFKEAFGVFAYYVKAVEQLTGFKPIKMRVTGSKFCYEGGINLFLVLNSSGTGGISNISPDASVDDGLLDFVAVINSQWSEVPKMILSFLKGEHKDNENIIFFRDSKITIENLDNDKRFTVTDLDGEMGPEMPVTIKNIHKAINIFCN